LVFRSHLYYCHRYIFTRLYDAIHKHQKIWRIKAGAIGAIFGLIIGLLSPIPFGFLIGPFAGAFIGEIVFNKTKEGQALKAAFGSFLGFIASTFMKLLVSFIFLGFFIWDLICNWSNFF
jgi:uncharacterized protein YqgC (DUF456 family)